MATTLQSYITQVAPSAAADLAPLVANDTYRKAVDAELAVREKASVAAAAEAARTEELHAGVAPFATAMGGIRAVAKRFPEASKFTDEAAKQMQLAMGAVAYNPQPLPTEKPASETPTVNATGATPPPPPPPAPPARP
jgi:hypothetical protein